MPSHEVKASFIIRKSPGRPPIRRGPFYGQDATRKAPSEEVSLYGDATIIVIELLQNDDMHPYGGPEYLQRALPPPS